MEKTIKKIAVEFSRVILGIVFIFSGFVKAIDPLGGAYKIQEYFYAFELSDLSFFAMPLTFLQAAIEFGVGVCLLIGIYRRFNSLLVLLIMMFMTPLTLYLAIANPVADCGCFGDALVISNWQTFYKNIFLLIAALIVFVWVRSMTSLLSHKRYFWASIWIYVYIFAVSFYCLRYLPVIDFRPYKIGVNIPEKREIPADAEQPEYDIKLYYSKNGIVKEFTVNDYPQGDSTWTFVDTKAQLIKSGYQPPIHDFSISDSDGFDITEVILSNPSYTFLLISNKIKEANDTNVDKINDIYDFSNEEGYDFYAVTSSSASDIQSWIDNTGAEYPFCTADDTMLKTIIRSNPGLLLLKDGTIIYKWPNTSLPDNDKLSALIEETDSGNIPTVHNLRTVLVSALILLIPLLILFFVSKKKDHHVKKHTKRHSRSGNIENKKNI